jgi:hypothetical protein
MEAAKMSLKYKGFWNGVNEKPNGEWIEIFASDCPYFSRTERIDFYAKTENHR